MICIATKLELLEDKPHTTTLTMMMQSANRFILEHISADYKKVTPNACQVDQECIADIDNQQITNRSLRLSLSRLLPAYDASIATTTPVDLEASM